MTFGPHGTEDSGLASNPIGLDVILDVPSVFERDFEITDSYSTMLPDRILRVVNNIVKLANLILATWK